MLEKGSGVGATDCLGARWHALASSAWFSNSLKSGSLLKLDCSGRRKLDGHHGGVQVVPRRAARHCMTRSAKNGYSSSKLRTESSESY